MPGSEDPEIAFSAAISAALPAAAQRRARTTLADEWSVPVFLPEDMHGQPGIAYVRKQELPAILQEVGYTHQPVSIILSEPPWQLHMPGYKAQKLLVTLLVFEQGERVAVERYKYLVSLNMEGPCVRFRDSGEVVAMQPVMHKMGIKMLAEGYPIVTTPSLVASALKQFLPEESFEDILCRDEHNTAVFMLAVTEVHGLLKRSGEHNFYFKMQEATTKFEILWLPSGMSHPQGLEALQGDAQAFGLVVKMGPSQGMEFDIKILQQWKPWLRSLDWQMRWRRAGSNSQVYPNVLGPQASSCCWKIRGGCSLRCSMLVMARQTSLLPKQARVTSHCRLALHNRPFASKQWAAKLHSWSPPISPLASGAGDAMQTDLATEARGAQQRRLKEALRKRQAALSPEPTKRNHDGAPTRQTPPPAKAKATA